jgi:hypothetical protein
MDGDPMYTLKDVPGKGKGLVARKLIPKGTRILEERPIVKIPKRKRSDEWLNANIAQQVDSLDEHQRQSFVALHNLYPYKNTTEMYLGIIRTNGLPVEAEGTGGAIFLEACRINHACDNNANKHWNKRIERHTVHALRDIPKGEEITIYYLGHDSSRNVRRQTLQDKFGFLCSCRLCSLEPAESQKSDQRLARIDQLDDLIGAECSSGNFSQQTLRYVDERVRLYNQQGPGNSGLPRAYLDAAQIAISNGDLARGSMFARRAVEGWRTAQGSNSDEVIQYAPLIQDPAKLPLYGISMKWKTSLEEFPAELNSNDFEDWLWKRKQPKKTHQSGQLANLRNRDIFPSFADLPYNLDSPGFHRGSQETYQSSRHWCFLGEITDSITLHHLELELTDADDKKIPLHFNTDGRGSEFSSAQLRKGHTVAILYAERHTFIHGDPGIKLIDPRMLKVCKTHSAIQFPFSMH